MRAGIPMFQDTLGAFVSAFLTETWTLNGGLFLKKRSWTSTSTCVVKLHMFESVYTFSNNWTKHKWQEREVPHNCAFGFARSLEVGTQSTCHWDQAMWRRRQGECDQTGGWRSPLQKALWCWKPETFVDSRDLLRRASQWKAESGWTRPPPGWRWTLERASEADWAEHWRCAQESRPVQTTQRRTQQVAS